MENGMPRGCSRDGVVESIGYVVLWRDINVNDGPWITSQASWGFGSAILSAHARWWSAGSLVSRPMPTPSSQPTQNSNWASLETQFSDGNKIDCMYDAEE
jgi:hypothetical protein